MPTTREKWLQIYYGLWMPCKEQFNIAGRWYEQWLRAFTQLDSLADLDELQEAIIAYARVGPPAGLDKVKEANQYVSDNVEYLRNQAGVILNKLDEAEPQDWEGGKRRRMWEAAKVDAEFFAENRHPRHRNLVQSSQAITRVTALEDESVAKRLSDAVIRTSWDLDGLNRFMQEECAGINALENTPRLSLKKKLLR